MSTNLLAVIFDLDGLLIDSEALWTDVRTKIVASYDGKYTKDAKRLTMGGDYRRGVNMIINTFNLPLNEKEFISLERKMLMKIYKTKVKFMPGAKQLLINIDKHKIPRAIATSSFRKRYNLTNKILNLKGFKAVVTGDEVENGKPAPDIYLEAAKRLKVDSKNCLVLEDSRFGIRSAKTAGMKTIAVIDRRFSDKSDFTGESKPDLIVNSLQDLSVEKLKKLFT